VEQDLMPGFADLQLALQADGADLALEKVRDGVATVRLILGPQACLDCIMPKETLEGMLLVSLRKSEEAIGRVEVIDPRLDPDWVAPAQ